MKTGIFRVDPETKKVEEVEPTTFSSEGFFETSDIHGWLVSNPSLFGEDLIIVGREHVGVRGSGRRPDILAIDREGNLVVIEVKRDEATIDTHWQAAVYAAFYWPRSGNDIVHLYIDYAEIEKEDAIRRLQEHTGSVDEQDLLKKLNAKQRLILVASSFPKEVTTTVLWLREQGVDASCLQLTPYPDRTRGTFYIQSRYIIPVPETRELMVELRKTQQERATQDAETEGRQNDATTQFMRAVSSQLNERLPDELRPEKVSRWAGQYGSVRYFKFWYDHRPWKNHDFCFGADLETEPSEAERGNVYTYFAASKRYLQELDYSEQDIETLKGLVAELNGSEGYEYVDDHSEFYVGKWVPSSDLSETGVDGVAEALIWLIQTIVPRIREIVENK